MLGAYGPGWGAAVAFPAVTALLALGSLLEREGDGITHLLRLGVGFTAGFLLATVPIASFRLAQIVSRAAPESVAELHAAVARLRAQLLLRWAVIALALPIGLTALVLRFQRAR